MDRFGGVEDDCMGIDRRAINVARSHRKEGEWLPRALVTFVTKVTIYLCYRYLCWPQDCREHCAQHSPSIQGHSQLFNMGVVHGLS